MNHLSLFSGIGGLDLASEWAGFKTIAFVEKDKFCQKVLAKHWPGVPIHDDVTTFTARDVSGPVTLLSGGFPCQPFSSGGKRMGNEDDRALWPEMFRLITEVRPAWVLGENVDGFVSLALDGVLSDLDRAGYEAITFVIPACAIGAPHIRDRVFVVAQNPQCGGFEGVLQTIESYGFQTHSPREWFTSNPLDAGSNIVNQLEKGSGEPAICGSDDGLPSWVDRLRALGNAVVPQQVYPILKAIAEWEQGVRD